MEISSELSVMVILNEEWVHDIFLTETSAWERVSQMYLDAGFRVVHERAPELRLVPAKNITLRKARPAMVRVMDSDGAVEYHSPDEAAVKEEEWITQVSN